MNMSEPEEETEIEPISHYSQGVKGKEEFNCGIEKGIAKRTIDIRPKSTTRISKIDESEPKEKSEVESIDNCGQGVDGNEKLEEVCSFNADADASINVDENECHGERSIALTLQHEPVLSFNLVKDHHKVTVMNMMTLSNANTLTTSEVPAKKEYVIKSLPLISHHAAPNNRFNMNDVNMTLVRGSEPDTKNKYSNKEGCKPILVRKNGYYNPVQWVSSSSDDEDNESLEDIVRPFHIKNRGVENDPAGSSLLKSTTSIIRNSSSNSKKVSMGDEQGSNGKVQQQIHAFSLSYSAVFCLLF